MWIAKVRFVLVNQCNYSHLNQFTWRFRATKHKNLVHIFYTHIWLNRDSVDRLRCFLQFSFGERQRRTRESVRFNGSQMVKIQRTGWKYSNWYDDSYEHEHRTGTTKRTNERKKNETRNCMYRHHNRPLVHKALSLPNTNADIYFVH